MLIFSFIIRLILKIIFRFIFLICENLDSFNRGKIKPLFNSFNDYLYNRACEAFDCGIEQKNENIIREEQEIVVPLFNRIGEFILSLVRLIFGRKKEFKNRNRKSAFMNRTKLGQHNKGVVSIYLARFQDLFRVLEY
tara:strand:+ start:82 stop:492 length:411 start_codon:yes stop_codon:yes gene_type:complete